MAKKARRTEKQQFMREYEASLQEEKKEQERQQRLEEEAEDLYWANILEHEAFREEQQRHLRNREPAAYCNFYGYYDDYGYDY